LRLIIQNSLDAHCFKLYPRKTAARGGQAKSMFGIIARPLDMIWIACCCIAVCPYSSASAQSMSVTRDKLARAGEANRLNTELFAAIEIAHASLVLRKIRQCRCQVN